VEVETLWAVENARGAITAMPLALYEGSAPAGPLYKFLETLTQKLNRFKATEKLVIELNTSSAATMPLYSQHLTLILPLYELFFTKWDLLYKNGSMPKALEVEAWVIAWMDHARQHITYALDYPALG